LRIKKADGDHPSAGSYSVQKEERGKPHLLWRTSGAGKMRSHLPGALPDLPSEVVRNHFFDDKPPSQTKSSLYVSYNGIVKIALKIPYNLKRIF
jgi:hypothetical protein